MKWNVYKIYTSNIRKDTKKVIAPVTQRWQVLLNVDSLFAKLVEIHYFCKFFTFRTQFCDVIHGITMHYFWSIFGTKQLSEVLCVYLKHLFIFQSLFSSNNIGCGHHFAWYNAEHKNVSFPYLLTLLDSGTWATKRGEIWRYDLGFTESYSHHP